MNPFAVVAVLIGLLALIRSFVLLKDVLKDESPRIYAEFAVVEFFIGALAIVVGLIWIT